MSFSGCARITYTLYYFHLSLSLLYHKVFRDQFFIFTSSKSKLRWWLDRRQKRNNKETWLHPAVGQTEELRWDRETVGRRLRLGLWWSLWLTSATDFWYAYPELQTSAHVNASRPSVVQSSEWQSCWEQTLKSLREGIFCQSGSTTRTKEKNGAQYTTTGAKTGAKMKFSAP